MWFPFPQYISSKSVVVVGLYFFVILFLMTVFFEVRNFGRERKEGGKGKRKGKGKKRKENEKEKTKRKRKTSSKRGQPSKCMDIHMSIWIRERSLNKKKKKKSKPMALDTSAHLSLSSLFFPLLPSLLTSTCLYLTTLPPGRHNCSLIKSFSTQI